MLERLKTMNTKTEENERTAEERCEKYFGISVWVEQKYEPCNYVIFEVPEEQHWKAVKRVQETMKKLQP